jgi:Bacterial capsule synthesis protein PGA_cap
MIVSWKMQRCELMVVSLAMLLPQPVHAWLVPPLAQTSQAQTAPPSPAAPPSQPAIAPVPAADPAKISEPTKSYPDIPATPPAYDEIVVTAVGDVMLGTTFPADSPLPPNDGADLLQEVTPLLKRGDVVLGNLEGPMFDGAGASAKCRGKAEGHCFAFRVPTRYGAHLKAAGFNVMGLANNHAMDFGPEGRESSRHVLEEQAIAHTGEVGDIARLTAKGRKIDVIAFATYPGAYNFLDLDDALDTIRKARAEADLVIVSFHGGAEGASHQHVAPGDEMFLGEDRGDLRKFAHAAIEAGAQLVIGSGPHVVRGMEIYQGKLIAYSLGNFATYGPFNLSGENGLSLVLEVHLAPDGSFFRGQVHPVRQEKPGGPRLDPQLAIVPILRTLSETDFRQSAVAVGPRGELWPSGTKVPECSNTPDLLEQPLNLKLCSIFP